MIRTRRYRTIPKKFRREETELGDTSSSVDVTVRVAPLL